MSILDGVDLALTANALTNATTAVINKYAGLSKYTTCTAANGACKLPAAPVAGAEYGVQLNDTVNTNATLLIFPPAGGSINGWAANTPYELPPRSAVHFVNTSRTAGVPDGVTWVATKAAHSCLAVTRAVNAGGAYAVLVSDHGKVLTATQAAANNLTLPATASSAGFECRVQLTGAAAHTVQVVADGAVVLGLISRAGAASLTAAPNTNVNFLTGAAVAGDMVHLVCNGVTWLAYGSTGAAAGMSFS